MKNMKVRLFKKTEKGTKKNPKGRSYYWVSVSDQNKDDEWISATMFARLSNKAATLFDSISETTSNDDIRTAYIEVLDGWLKAVEGKEHNTVILFINNLKDADSEDD